MGTERIKALNQLNSNWHQSGLLATVDLSADTVEGSVLEDLLQGLPDVSMHDKTDREWSLQAASALQSTGHIRVAQGQDRQVYKWLYVQRKRRSGNYRTFLALTLERIEALNRLDSNWFVVSSPYLELSSTVNGAQATPTAADTDMDNGVAELVQVASTPQRAEASALLNSASFVVGPNMEYTREPNATPLVSIATNVDGGSQFDDAD